MPPSFPLKRRRRAISARAIETILNSRAYRRSARKNAKSGKKLHFTVRRYWLCATVLHSGGVRDRNFYDIPKRCFDSFVRSITCLRCFMASPSGAGGHYCVHVLAWWVQVFICSQSIFSCHCSASLPRLRCGRCPSHAAWQPQPLYTRVDGHSMAVSRARMSEEAPIRRVPRKWRERGKEWRGCSEIALGKSGRVPQSANSSWTSRWRFTFPDPKGSGSYSVKSRTSGWRKRRKISSRNPVCVSFLQGSWIL